MKDEIKGIFVVVGLIIAFVALISFMFPFTTVEHGCYEDISQEVCGERDVSFIEKGVRFSCSSPPVNASSRLAEDQKMTYEKYVFIEEDHKKCVTGKYHYWRRIE